jgi:hypothetical protein
MRNIIIIFILLTFVGLSCSQTIPLGYRWDKNVEPDVSHYDLFTLVSSDSSLFSISPHWPADTTETVYIDSVYHMKFLLATVAHINSPVDSMVFQFNQPMFQGWMRAYILAADSAGNTSSLAPSLNVVYIGDREPPAMPGENFIFKRN